MQTHTMLEKFDSEQEKVEQGHLQALDETCRILNGLKLCSRFCVECQIACNITEITVQSEKKVEIWNPSPVVVRRR